jgi:predicted NAD/FAD-binding protein
MINEARRVAVIGAGISGLGCAWLLGQKHDVTVYEAKKRLGGHSNTVDVEMDGRQIPVDTGFIVYNEPNYPNLVGLFDALGVRTEASDMSFAVSLANGGLEWSGTTIGTLFAQKRNLARPGFHRMWLEILRFNRAAPRDWQAGRLDGQSLGQYLDTGGYGATFRQHYLLPMGAAIWSAPMEEMLAFPARSFVRFCMNHGLLTVNDRPQWRTVSGGSRQYVTRLRAATRATFHVDAPVVAVRRTQAGIAVTDASGRETLFDAVVFATHANETIQLADATMDADERAILGAFRYQHNRAILHCDVNLMPRRRKVWASWNYLGGAAGSESLCVTYWMNRLQNIESSKPILVTLNPVVEPAADTVFGRFDYAHPLFDAAAVAAQRRLPALQGRDGFWYCGAWTGYGFHEDGLTSGIAVAEALGARRPWLVRDDAHRHPALAATLPATATAREAA